MKYRYIVVFSFSNKTANVEITRKRRIKTFEDFRVLTNYLKKEYRADAVVITNVMRLPL